MQMNDENIQTEEIKQAAEPEFKFPDDAESTSRPNETAEVVTRETAEETNTELLQSIDKKLDMLLAAQGGIIVNTPIAVRIECAKGEILNAMEAIQTKHALPPCIMDGVLSSVLAEVRSEAKIELINSTNSMMAEKDEDLEKAKKAAKRTLRTEPEEQTEE